MATVSDADKAAQDRAQATAKATAKRLADAKAAAKAATLALVSSTNAAFLKSDFAPDFLPFKDRDGSICTCLVTGYRDGVKRGDDGNPVIDPTTRETTPAYEPLVFVFSALNVPYATVYDFAKNALPAPAPAPATVAK